MRICNMPSCIINQCRNTTGKKQKSKAVILHSFPRNLDRIRQWLLHTGQQFTDVDELAQRILEQNKYRLCSEHFASDSYIHNVGSRTLRPEAVPTNFPTCEEGDVLIEENLKKAIKRKRCIDTPNLWLLTEPNLEEAASHDVCDMSTQTDFTLLNSVVIYSSSSRLLNTADGPDFQTLPSHASHTVRSSFTHHFSTPNPKEVYTECID
ncbi:hypothetical protein GDO81_019727 [Engystomops pustulosus]|uniref:THAP-type domain-containing protein n=1 Tax=Engystomops pustulosus TaxID=76066 RepID=A0AAV6ZCQ9_ENGPU|nr:hypothetical protein GDO81_019727 [Engystomops pustulosus]